MKKSWLLVVIMILAVSSLALAADMVSAPFIKSAPVLDGKLDDEAWAMAAEKGGKVTLDYNLNGKPASGVETEVYVAWDYDYLYVAFKCYQDESTLINTIANDGGAVWVDEDDVELFFDTVYPASTYKQFVSNPNGIRSVVAAGWDVWAEIYDDHWVVEMAFPYDVFNMWPDVGDEWGVNFSRHVGYLTGAGDGEWFTFSPLVGATFLDASTLCLLEFVK
ncbi:MAG: sugar-binding protein [Bacillota bacterium]